MWVWSSFGCSEGGLQNEDVAWLVRLKVHSACPHFNCNERPLETMRPPISLIIRSRKRVLIFRCISYLSFSQSCIQRSQCDPGALRPAWHLDLQGALKAPPASPLNARVCNFLFCWNYTLSRLYMYGHLNAHRSEQVVENGWVWRLVNHQKLHRVRRFLVGGGGEYSTLLWDPPFILFSESWHRSAFFQRLQASVARVCALTVNHEEGLLRPCETIATVTGFECGR